MIHVGRRVTAFALVIAALAVSPEFAFAVDFIDDSVTPDPGNISNEILQDLEPTNATDLYTEDKTYNVHGKPSKFDEDFAEMQSTDDILHLEGNGTRCPENSRFCGVTERLENWLGAISGVDSYNISEGVQIVKNENATLNESDEAFPLSEKVAQFARNHALQIKLPTYLVSPRAARTFFGTFGLKKLLLPLILGVQIIKSILIALFLPSIIGTVVKIAGKGVSSFAQSSQGVTAAPEDNFEFKDNAELYNDDYMTNQPLGTLPASAMYDETMLQKNPDTVSRFGFADPRLPHGNKFSDRYYMRYADNSGGFGKKQDFKIFHEIPTSSLLLTNYDPFYSPLLSRLDAVFSRLGHVTEDCREYAVCAMYRSPARFAPYSNLVSAQLSRELNELRKPSSDNPDVLRFFRYMKSAKDGQEGVRCEDLHRHCAMAQEDQSQRQNQAMLATYQDIDKLVHARNL